MELTDIVKITGDLYVDSSNQYLGWTQSIRGHSSYITNIPTTDDDRLGLVNSWVAIDSMPVTPGIYLISVKCKTSRIDNTDTSTDISRMFVTKPGETMDYDSIEEGLNGRFTVHSFSKLMKIEEPIDLYLYGYSKKGKWQVKNDEYKFECVKVGYI